MIDTYERTFIDSDALDEWLNEALKNFVPEGTHISIIPQAWEAKGESRFFSEIDVNDDISISQLLSKVVAEHSRGPYLHFYPLRRKTPSFRSSISAAQTSKFAIKQNLAS